jgi:hypothetical protein
MCDAPSLGRDFDSTPAVVGQIEIDASLMFGHADMDRAFGRVKLRPRFQQIELRGDNVRARNTSGGFVVTATQPAPETLAADGPGSPVTIDQEIGIGGAGGGVEGLAANPNPYRRRQAGA